MLHLAPISTPLLMTAKASILAPSPILAPCLDESLSGNARLDSGVRVEHPGGPSEGEIGIVADQCDQTLWRPVAVLLPDKASPGAACGEGRDILHVVEKGEIGTPGIRQSGDIVKQPRRVMVASDTRTGRLKYGASAKGP